MPYIAYAIYDIELGCGCTEARHMPVYDHTGNKHKQFESYEEAVTAAKEKMIENNCDRWHVI